ncbi:MAG: hypothetical protein JJV93_02110 [Alphaproteobacteria bacterium]|nr:hypothetical protein [Alphaproteobacteria bacterium]
MIVRVLLLSFLFMINILMLGLGLLLWGQHKNLSDITPFFVQLSLTESEEKLSKLTPIEELNTNSLKLYQSRRYILDRLTYIPDDSLLSLKTGKEKIEVKDNPGAISLVKLMSTKEVYSKYVDYLEGQKTETIVRPRIITIGLEELDYVRAKVELVYFDKISQHKLKTVIAEYRFRLISYPADNENLQIVRKHKIDPIYLFPFKVRFWTRLDD